LQFSPQTQEIIKFFLKRAKVKLQLISVHKKIPPQIKYKSDRRLHNMRNGVSVQEAEKAIDKFQEVFKAIQAGVHQDLVGQDDVIRLLTAGLMSGGHMLLIGVPGLAKTMMAKIIARVLGWDFRRIQFTPDLMPSDIIGTEILQTDESGRRRELVFHQGPIFANLILADEINRTPPKTQAALLEAMQELAVTAGGLTYPLARPFVVIATQNPIEQEGTYPLPEAQLDRFMLSIHVDYPSPEAELEIAMRPARMEITEIEPVCAMETFQTLLQIVDQVPVANHVLKFAVDLVAASRPQNQQTDGYVRKYVNWGAGPRATQHLVTAAKAMALMDGRPAPEIRDIRSLADPVLCHRIIPNFTALGEGIDSHDIVRQLLATARESA
jgi:MoxR-like ATPase